MSYIEKRKTWIKAIHKCITEKWNPICMDYHQAFPECALCEKHHNLAAEMCSLCPLKLAGNGCEDNGSTYRVWADTTEALECEECSHADKDCSGVQCPDEGDHEKSEAMLEALVMLLPPEERERYGG